MANTTNYNWETPDDTDLVKDGAAAIRTLGNSIDTTTKNLNPETTTGDIAYRSATANTNTRLAIGTTGQVLTVAGGVPSWAAPSGGGDLVRITTNTFSAQTSLIFTDCFSATYDNYLLIASVICSAGTPNVDVLLRASGSNYTTNDQVRGLIYLPGTSNVTGYFSSSVTQMANYSTNTGRLNFSHQIFNPFLTQRTQMIGNWIDSTDTGTEFYYAGNTNSYTSLNITVSSGTFTGEISIYGYKRS